MNSHVWRHRLVTGLTLVGWLLVAGSAFADVDSAKPETEPGSDDKAATAPATQPATSTATAEAEDKEKEPETVPLSFKDAPMDLIAKFLTERLGKPVIPDKAVKDIKITVVNPKPLPPDKAMYVLTTALHEYGVAIEEREQTVHLVPIADVTRRQIPTIPPEVDIRTITPTNKIVRKFFLVRHYDPTKLMEVLQPLLPEAYGHITADATTKKLMVVASVERLITMDLIIQEFDRPDVSGGELRAFHIQHVHIYEIIPTLEKLIAGYLGVEVKSVSSTGGAKPSGRPSGRPGPDGRPQPPSGKPGGDKAAGGGAVSIKAEKTPVLLIPDPRRDSIVVAAPSNVLDQIEIWLETLDQPKPPSTQWEIVDVTYGDAGDLANQLGDMLDQIPDQSLNSALKLFPFPSSRQIMIVGSAENREIVKEWLEEIDISDTGQRIQKTFELEYADAQKVSEEISDLFGSSSGRMSYYERYYQARYGTGSSNRDKVTVTANTRRNAVTVMASPEKMERIDKHIEEMDKPLEGDQAAPLIITLKYADPAKTKELLENLFSKKEESRSWGWYWDDDEEETDSPVGRLFGQFSFEAYPDTGKLIVVSKNEENYDIIKKMIEEIDSPQEAGVPRTIQLKFADAETVAEQLNALLNAPGTPTQILRRGRIQGFEMFTDDRSPYAQAPQNRPQQQQSQDRDQSQTVMSFWWQQPAPAREITTRQPSNLVGKLRIVPNIERNMLLVAVPDEYADALQELVEELDRPGYQVLIKAVVAEATLDDSMSLGFRFSTDPNQFITGDTLQTDNALRGLFEYEFQDTHANTHSFTFNADVNNLISLLGKQTDIKIVSEPKILTADNVEGEFFDGQDIPFVTDSTLSEIGETLTFDYFPVGITLRVRPHITEEKTVNLRVQLRVSSVIPGRTLFRGAIVDRRETSTQITLEHGRTFMVSGILREQDREIVRKVPGLGDIPLLGELFKHREIGKVNTELLVFLTPYVIETHAVNSQEEPIEDEPMKEFKERWPDTGIGKIPEPEAGSFGPTSALDPEIMHEGG